MNGIIYRYTAPNGKHYIGQTIEESRRISAHKLASCSGVFHRAIKKYGFCSFEYTVLHRGIDNFDDLNRLEQEEISRHNSISPNGYNLNSGGKNGRPCEEVRCKMRASQIGRKHSKETIDKMRIVQAGKKISQETREKLSMANIGRKHSEEAKDKIRAAHTGRKLSKESIEKIRVTKIGKKRPKETIEKMRAANLGKKHSKETIEKRKISFKLTLAKRRTKTTPKQLELNLQFLE
jgi:group I intron endonuclease